ncbi:hypothetical protein HMPREF3034_01616 [Prevotella sp. DNF00663]|uniref:hypothetical protein n=1 Tax=Prevotella sp. DNF00663 TaxID=1384078 RepID=UPI0007925B8D|nr:hypothetical protein [Prevotella sp. DNF00663]KXB82436.1 hypothetical protein HMPREF3034_01616 [Prevotella sp. DNF00663]
MTDRPVAFRPQSYSLYEVVSPTSNHTQTYLLTRLLVNYQTAKAWQFCCLGFAALLKHRGSNVAEPLQDVEGKEFES